MSRKRPLLRMHELPVSWIWVASLPPRLTIIQRYDSDQVAMPAQVEPTAIDLCPDGVFLGLKRQRSGLRSDARGIWTW